MPIFCSSLIHSSVFGFFEKIRRSPHCFPANTMFSILFNDYHLSSFFTSLNFAFPVKLSIMVINKLWENKQMKSWPGLSILIFFSCRVTGNLNPALPLIKETWKSPLKETKRDHLLKQKETIRRPFIEKKETFSFFMRSFDKME